MKVVNVAAQLFAIFAFLTLGSLLIIVGFHILSAEDAVFKIRELYQNGWHSFQTGLLGLCFIGVGLIFSRMLLKSGRQTEAIIFQSEAGPVVIGASAIEDVVKRVIKKYNLVKDLKIKTLVRGKDVELKLRLTLWSGGQVPQLLQDVQSQVKLRVLKLLGPDNRVEVNCDVKHIEDHEAEINSYEEINQKAKIES